MATKLELAQALDDIMYLPPYRRGLGFRQLMRLSKHQLEIKYAVKMRQRLIKK